MKKFFLSNFKLKIILSVLISLFMPVRHFEDWNLYSYKFLLREFLFYIEEGLQKRVIFRYFCFYFVFLFLILSFIFMVIKNYSKGNK
ncbi:MAG: hypothetical protein V1860_00555 [bacterium]